MLADHSVDSAESPLSTEYMRTKWTRNEQKVNICVKTNEKNFSEHGKTRIRATVEAKNEKNR